MAEILIVEDDESIATGLALNLRIEGHAPTAVGDGEKALAVLHAGRVELVLLDISLPGMSGLDILDHMRKAGDRTPVIVLSARRDEFDKVAALKLGADDYVTKPFALAELLARVVAVLRRSGAPRPVADPEAADLFRFSDVSVNLATRQALRDGEEVRLTHLEFELLMHFLRNPTRVFSREDLLRDVWGLSSATRRTVDNFVAQLRSKLERDPEAPRHLVTVRGSGYRFDP
jgi:two-component system, OmpR family, alkaline phosphatase synthesis response regulator PhoP